MKSSIAIVLLAICSTIGCTPRVYTEYILVTRKPISMYDSLGFNGTRYVDIPTGDTLSIFVPGKKGRIPSSSHAIYKENLIWTPGIYVTNMSRKTRHKASAYRLKRHTYKSFISATTYRDYLAAQRQISTPATNTTKPIGSTPSTGATIHTGPRGGRYYINSKGNKTYIKK